MALPEGVLSSVQSDWGWVLLFVYVAYQVYWPLWQTKLQTAQHSLTDRLENIETTQVAIAQEVEGVSDERVSHLHERTEVNPSDLKDNGSTRDPAKLD